MMKTKMKRVFVTVGIVLPVLTATSEPTVFTDFNIITTPTGQLATLEFSTDTDKLYDVQKTPDLMSNDWNVVVDDLPGNGFNQTVSDLTPLASPAFFYRLTASDAPPANLISNGGFEEPALASGGTTIDASGDWIQDESNQGIQKAAWASETGEQGAWLKGWDSNLDQSFYQDVPATAGVEYTLNAAFNFNDNFESNGSTLEMALVWFDADGLEIDRLMLNVNANLDASEGWKQLGLIGIAPAGTATARVLFHWTTGTVIETTQASAMVDNVSLTSGPLGSSVNSANWTSLINATYAAAAQYAGVYAMADSSSIEVTDINQDSMGTIALTDVNGMAFTSSGRQLFIAAPTAVKAFNTGTGSLRDHVTGLDLGTGKTGIAHFKGELFVGTADGDILRYDAQLDDLTGSYNGTIAVGEAVRSMAVDIQDGMLYVATPTKLYRLDPATEALTEISTLSGIESISYGRTYGSNGQGGLAVLQDVGTERIIHLASTADLQAGGSVTLRPYYSTRNPVPDIALTACGRMLAASTVPVILSDSQDSRMDFMEWVADEFDQNVRFAKVLCWQDGGLTGMVQNTVTSFGRNRGSVASPDAAYWVVNQLLMSHYITGDLEAQSMVREIVKRYASLHVNTDGQWYHWYDSKTGDRTWGDAGPDAETSAYSTMKAIHMAIRAKTYFWYDTEIVEAADSMINALRNQRDYVREFGSFASPADDLGPVIGGHRPSPYQELHLYSELMAATEPMCENAYNDYWRDRDDHTYDYTMPEEPIVRTRMAGFWRMYDQATVGFCNTDPVWQEEFKNFGSLFGGWTDDNAPEHLTAFSAGQVPDTSKPDPSTTYTYSSDKYTSHPGTVNSFGTVIGFGLHGNTAPVVGAYFAYRDGRRQVMEGSDNYDDPHLLTRISYDYPSWAMNNLSPTDHQYAGYALGELLKPGSVENTIALHTYIEPNWHTETSGDKTIDFSRLIKRQVWGTTDGTNWESLGYQHSPYTVASSSPYLDFKVTGAEGELLSASATGTNEETFDVNDDFDGTLYIIRAVTSESGPLRARWYNGTALLSTQTGTSTLLEAVKPTGATDLKVDLSGDVFDQVSVVLDGLPELFTNHDFELGNLTGWNKYSSDSANINGANAADSRLGGARALELTANAGTPDGKYAQVLHTFDISGDPVDTHYVLEFDALSENLQGSSLRIFTTVPDCDYDEINDIWNDRVDYFDTFERADDRTVLSAGLRKRNAQHLELQVRIRLRRDDSSAVTADERVLIDNLRLLKMKP